VEALSCSQSFLKCSVALKPCKSQVLTVVELLSCESTEGTSGSGKQDMIKPHDIQLVRANHLVVETSVVCSGPCIR
jgi:hypothetical protein